jgi:hypothetical protein
MDMIQPSKLFRELKEKEMIMNTKTEGTIALTVALFVLVSAMLDARVSAVIAVIALAALGIFKLTVKNK